MVPGRRPLLVLICASLAFSLPLRSAEVTTEGREFFESRIRPILAQECYECHRSGGKRMAGLALDHRQALLDGGDSGPALKPGSPDTSLLIQVIRHEHEDFKMPEGGAKLDPEIIEDFVHWISTGASDPRDSPPSEESVLADTQWDAVLERRKHWWSFLPLKKPDLPKGDEEGHLIDQLLGKQLAKVALRPSPEADRLTLIRRLSFVLIGLPPTEEEIDAFVNDLSPGAYERLVDTYLQSSHFGERWARHWMDWVRYADSHGSEGDPEIPYAYRYRDYLVRALNSDVAYDQLVREHLAGDLLPKPRMDHDLQLNESKIGPAHLRMVFHGFAPTDALGEQVRFTDDQINVVSKAFLGLTISCARCHHHKFDAISQQDFYSWYGIFASCAPASVSASAPPTADERALRTDLAALKVKIRASLAATWKANLTTLGPHIASLHTDEKPGNLLDPWRAQQDGKPVSDALHDWKKRSKEHAPYHDWNFKQSQEIHSWTIDGESITDKAPAGEFSVAADGAHALTGIYPAGYYSHLLSSKDRGLLLSPRVLLEKDSDLWLEVAGDGDAIARYAVQNYPRDGTVYPVRRLSGGSWHWERFPLDYWTGDHIHVELSTSADQPVLARTHMERSWIGVRRVALFPKGVAPAGSKFEFGEPLLQALETSPDNLVMAYRRALEASIDAWAKDRATDAQALFLDQALRTKLLPNELDALPDTAPLIQRYRTLEKGIRIPVRVPGVIDRPPFDQALMIRGDHKQLGAPVPRAFLDAIDPTPYSNRASGRLELANDIFRPDNPLSRRVIANRVWHHVFGEGLVRTPDNLGRLGAPPSHPELLDHLAIWFEENGYSIKALIRYLVTSHAWKASSEPPPSSEKIDPENRLLSHAHVRRLEGEALRDALLAVSGRLDRSMPFGGPPVDGHDAKRSVYLRVKRNDLDPFLGTFDAPVPASTTGRRDVTNVPGQSLTMLNDPFVIDLARTWSERLQGDPRQRVETMYLQALGRKPSAIEINEAIAYVRFAEQDTNRLLNEYQLLESKFTETVDALNQLTQRSTERVFASRGEPPRINEALPRPIAQWNFEGDLQDQIGSLHGTSHGSARVEDGALVLDGQGHVSTPMTTWDLFAKTLVARVRLDTLDQGGGGVMSIQADDTFDSIVFAERESRQWMAGSNGFSRTDSFQGVEEADAVTASIQIAIVYSEDGTITGYRDGQLYGRAYKSNGPHRFEAATSEILFGLRHGEANDSRRLRGKIEEASLYNRALHADEVAALAATNPNHVSAAELLEIMSASERSRFSQLLAEKTRIQEERAAFEGLGAPPTGWAELAHAIFNLKEFLFLR